MMTMVKTLLRESRSVLELTASPFENEKRSRSVSAVASTNRRGSYHISFGSMLALNTRQARLPWVQTARHSTSSSSPCIPTFYCSSILLRRYPSATSCSKILISSTIPRRNAYLLRSEHLDRPNHRRQYGFGMRQWLS